MTKQERLFSLKDVLTTSKLYLQIHNKYHFVIRCHIDRKTRNFPTANLLETALLEFDIAVRDYQREVPDKIKQCQRVDIEGYTLSVEDIRRQNSNPDEVKSFALAQRRYFEESRRRYCEDMQRTGRRYR
jgi:hypothetical protein